jgi:methyl acetate hydrolase
MSEPGEILREAVAAGALPNVTAIVGSRDGVRLVAGAGPRVAGAHPGDGVGADSIYRIKSMTKIITNVVALRLVEEGALDLDAPVDRYAPDFRRVQVLDGWDGETPRLRAPRTRATVRQLLTQTVGFGYWFWNPDLVRLGATPVGFTPLLHDPGTQWTYGSSVDWLGLVIEGAAQESLESTTRSCVLDPLGMTETVYEPTPDQRARCVPVHVRDAQGSWRATGGEGAQGPPSSPGGRSYYSTPNDFMRLQRMLLRGGELDGTRILGEKSVAAMGASQIGRLTVPRTLPTADPSASATFPVGPGHTWGLGLLLNRGDLPGRRRAGSGAWSGLANTHFWVDPTSGIAGAFFSQFTPFATPESMAVFRRFEEAVYAHLVPGITQGDGGGGILRT